MVKVFTLILVQYLIGLLNTFYASTPRWSWAIGFVSALGFVLVIDVVRSWVKD